MYRTYLNLILVFIFLISNFCLICHAEDEAQENKTDEEIVQQEEINPIENYRLIAVYMVNKKLKALIKNISTPEEGTKEYRTGDYLDELQTISIAKISINPTTRVEIIDQNGLSFLLKQTTNPDDKQTTKPKTPYAKSSPSYTYGKTYKIKPKGEASQETTTKKELKTAVKKDSTEGTEQQATQESSSLKPVSMAEQEGLTPKTNGKEATKETTKEATKTDTSQTGTSKPPDKLDVSRPSNPFEE